MLRAADGWTVGPLTGRKEDTLISPAPFHTGLISRQGNLPLAEFVTYFRSLFAYHSEKGKHILRGRALLAFQGSGTCLQGLGKARLSLTRLCAGREALVVTLQSHQGKGHSFFLPPPSLFMEKSGCICKPRCICSRLHGPLFFRRR